MARDLAIVSPYCREKLCLSTFSIAIFGVYNSPESGIRDEIYLAFMYPYHRQHVVFLCSGAGGRAIDVRSARPAVLSLQATCRVDVFCPASDPHSRADSGAQSHRGFVIA